VIHVVHGRCRPTKFPEPRQEKEMGENDPSCLQQEKLDAVRLVFAVYASPMAFLVHRFSQLSEPSILLSLAVAGRWVGARHHGQCDGQQHMRHEST
jgi:hypothetical protein